MQTSSYAGVVSMVAQGSPKPLVWVQILAPVPSFVPEGTSAGVAIRRLVKDGLL